MKLKFGNIKGDRMIWAIVALLAIFSFLPVYSAASNLAYTYGDGQTFSYLVKHFVHLFLGFSIIYGIHRIPYRYFKGLSMVMFPVVLILLLVTLLQGTTIDGANASRWIRVPFVGFTFQPSTLAALVLMVFVARYLSKVFEQKITFKSSLVPLWLPVFVVLILILPANFSTTAIIFTMILVLAFLGGYPLKYLGAIVGSGLLVLAFFVLLAKAFPDAMPNRVDTWTSRIANFMDDHDSEEDYQIEKAKIAIATGSLYGLGPGKSVQKNFLPQSSSDFIFAIIIEEYGLLGGLFLLILYLLLLFRIVIVAQKAETVFAKLLTIGVGLPIIFQALINMGVAVELFPVTGQTLPLISSGGTSIWVTCLGIGIILSVSAKREEIKNQYEGEQHPLEILSEAL
ncbi:FtsW/RodA/SpoVE family cell cycle protein [Flavobacteriaceae bacterium]|nr:FtsW/RodA/SpoVE family cell cycle protein [Flavobacteriaceae bacterium]MDB2632360.1 FtsW/RodA/SpoVE family cell cycle protein [Flavobacteriaceae bacterium]